MIKILIFDKEEYWNNYLKTLPYDITLAFSEKEVFEYTFKQKFDFYIFDFEDGYNVLKQLRQSGDKTIAIFLSHLETFNAQKKAYEVGDDFFKKSVTYLEEIKIKLDYYIKKHFQIKDIIKYGDIYLNTKLKTIYKNSKKIELTPLEFELLVLFFKNKNRYLPTNYIIDTLDITNGSLKVKLSYFRKLGFEIINKRELGYKLKETK